jgi:hypothetical protein
LNISLPKSWLLSILLACATTQAWSYGKSMPSPGAGAIAHTAEVLETMSSAGYTYVRVQEEGRAYWIALPQTSVEVGEKISFFEQMLMENFTSPTLNRTFDRILFVEAINRGGELPAQAAAQVSPHQRPAQPPVALDAPTALGSPEGRYAIQAVFAKKGELSGKVIEVKGKVVKLSRRIMNRDWVHLEDGSGTAQDKNNRIVVLTTQSSMAVGDEVLAKGRLVVDRDFGYGYFYPVLLEDAEFTK